MGKDKTLEKIERLLDQLSFNDQQKEDWVSEYKDRSQILRNNNVEDTIKCILFPLIFGDKPERRRALKLLELTFVNRDSLGGVGHTIDIFRGCPEPLIDTVNVFRGYARMVRTPGYKRKQEWERTYGASLQGELLEAVMAAMENSGVSLTEEKKAKIRADHRLYAMRLERDKEREQEREVPSPEKSEDFRKASTLDKEAYLKYIEDKERRAENKSKPKKTKAKPPFKGAQDALDLINDTGRHPEIKMEHLRYAHGERPFAISVFAAMHSLTYDGVEEIYAEWEKQNPSNSPAKNKK